MFSFLPGCRKIKVDMIQNQFVETYSKFIQKFLKPQKPLKIVFDCSDGTAGLVLKKIESPLNSKFYILNSKPDGHFPAHGPNPSKPGAAKQLQAAVKKHKADLGIIFDADGDRMLCADDKSRFVDSEVGARLLIWHLKPKKIIIDATSGWLIKEIQSPRNQEIEITESKVGQCFIKQKMRAENADFGVERSGHYYFKKFFGLDSGILAAVEIINALSKLPYKFSDFVDLLPRYYRSEIDFKLSAPSINHQELLKKTEDCFKSKVENYKLLKISHLDGLTMEFGDKIGFASRSLGEGWWFNLRFSNTEPLLRLNVETKSQLELKKQVAVLVKFIEANQL